ncbi:3101_t:CDS:2 [Cetraspora pellucida]|uniref:3101_t:CDS:1 n=1 Tax=Cetraspora pellucida TaxID=1433469 RepID=A0A9N8Z192_9GLOM|nr:3101_t:CDS:2 [Cetraspora pellucida]
MELKLCSRNFIKYHRVLVEKPNEFMNGLILIKVQLSKENFASIDMYQIHIRNYDFYNTIDVLTVDHD